MVRPVQSDCVADHKATTCGSSFGRTRAAAHVSVASSPQSGTIRNVWLLRAQRGSQFIVGMVAPTSGDSFGDG